MPPTHLIVDGAPEPVRHQHAHPPQLPAAATVLVGPQPRVGQAKANGVLEKRERELVLYLQRRSDIIADKSLKDSQHTIRERQKIRQVLLYVSAFVNNSLRDGGGARRGEERGRVAAERLFLPLPFSFGNSFLPRLCVHSLERSCVSFRGSQLGRRAFHPEA